MNGQDSTLALREEQLGVIYGEWLECLERGETPDRTAFLARHPEFAAELESFLADEERLQKLAAPLRAAAHAARVTVSMPWQTPGESAADAAPMDGSFGDYELLEEIGRGGMGIVFRARQKSLGRFVALKVFRADPTENSADLQRFCHEAAVIAQLDHPHVVPIHEVGEYRGRVYFSMRLVDGGSLDAHLERFRSDPRASATLLAAIARAVHHAHQRGILHRDLKPANILLASSQHGARAADFSPMVTDFGLAKWTESDVSLTHAGALVGTPAYMAPEQAAGQRAAITTASDVYGLGAVLYALLTGRAPFRGDSVFETLEQVKNSDPEPPRRSNPDVPRDLETICLRCLRKEPERRYESAAALADDLDRWLRGEPILARPVGRPERCWRWCRRQPVQAALTAALVLALALGFGLVLWQWRRAEDHAEIAEELRLEAVARQVEIDESFQLAHGVVRDFTARMRDSGRDDAPSLDPLYREFLQKTQAYYRKFLERRGNDPKLRRELADASAALADVTRQLGAPAEALPAYQRALELAEDVIRDEPDSSVPRLERAKLHNHIGAVLDMLGHRDAALASLQLAREGLEQALAAHPKDFALEAELATTHHNAGMIYTYARQVDRALASFAEAQASYERLLRARPDHTDTLTKRANTVNSRGVVLIQNGRVGDALAPFQEAVKLREQLVQRFPGKAVHRSALAQSLCNLGDCLQEQRRFKEAIHHLPRAQALLEEIVRASPHVAGYQVQLGLCHAIVGHTLFMTGDAPRALESYVKGRSIFRRLATTQPQVPDYQHRLVSILLEMADAHTRLGNEDTVLALYQEARALQSRLVETFPEQPAYATRLAIAVHNHAVALARMRRLDAARRTAVEAAQWQLRALDKAPDDAQIRHRLAGHYRLQSSLERDLGHNVEALAAAAQQLRYCPADAKELYGVARDLAQAGAALKGEVATSQRYSELALAALRRAVQAGFRDAERARTDAALESLRSHADFKKLLAEMAREP